MGSRRKSPLISLFRKRARSMFTKHSDDGFSSPVKGIKLKTLVYGDKTLLTRFNLTAGNDLPIHTHPHEQTGFLVSGKIVLFIGDEEFMVEPGDAWTIPGNVEHGAKVLEDAVAVEVFSPVREDYLPEKPQA